MVEETVIGPPGDFPIIPAKSQGRPYKTAWMLTMNPDRRAASDGRAGGHVRHAGAP
jgi:hypothetical protein